MAQEVNTLITEIETEKEKQALAELKALQSQIRPHFLYNALGAISWKAKEYHQYEIDPEITEQLIPKIILQPIVENSINHGFRNHNISKGLIRVKFCKIEENLYFEVADNGVGFESFPDELPKSQSEDGGYGLYNVNERLTRYYGKNHQLRIQSTPGIGTKVYGIIPLS